MTAPVVGYVFGYATLADADDELVLDTRSNSAPVYGHIEGFRRRWSAGMENRAPLNDHKHYVDAATGERPDIYVVALNVERGEGRVNGMALPVTAEALPVFDHRELHYDRIDVSDAFSEALGLPVWTYTANGQARSDYAAGQAQGRAYIRRTYFETVNEVFRKLGDRAWADFEHSTDPAEVPLRDLIHISVDE